jgi:hypothetical protein
MHTLPKHFVFIKNANVISEELFNLLLRQIDKYELHEALKTIDVIHKILGPLPSRISISGYRNNTILRLNSIKKVLNAHLDTRTTF